MLKVSSQEIPNGKHPELTQQKVSVTFHDQVTSDSQLADQCKNFKNPHIFIWFMGRDGFRKSWAKYLIQHLIKPIRELVINTQFHLCDLRNWTQLRKPKALTSKLPSKVVKRIEGLNCKDIEIVSSGEFFKFMKQDKNEEAIQYVQDVVWKRKFIWEKSQAFDPRGMLVSSLGEDYKYLQILGDKDISHCYSALQYFEAIYYVEKIVDQLSASENDVVFLLPNDEYLYYFDRERSFEKDVANLLPKSFQNSNKKLRIHFLPFKWGTEQRERPYLSGGDPIKGKDWGIFDQLAKV